MGEPFVLRSGTPAEPDAIVTAHHHHIEDLERKVVVDLIALWHVAEAKRRRARHRSAQWLEGAEQRTENGGLPGAVRPDEPQKIALGYVERDVGEHCATPIAERRAIEGYE